MSNTGIRNFYRAILAETVRYTSNTRNNEFKLYRISSEKIGAWSPDVIEIFLERLNKNSQGNEQLFDCIDELEQKPIIDITKGNSMTLSDDYAPNCFDLLITSPPYGDSRTTVAYGQFSRLALQWLDMEIAPEIKLNQLDNIMLGGKVHKDLNMQEQLFHLKSVTLTDIYYKIKERDEKRANEVLQFYIDLDVTLGEIARVMKKGSYQFWVVANRTVKSVKVPTDAIIAELFEKYNIFSIHRFYRNIPNKRMPMLNSPSNIAGKRSVTMTRETILMLKKCR